MIYDAPLIENLKQIEMYILDFTFDNQLILYNL